MGISENRAQHLHIWGLIVTPPGCSVAFIRSWTKSWEGLTTRQFKHWTYRILLTRLWQKQIFHFDSCTHCRNTKIWKHQQFWLQNCTRKEAINVDLEVAIFKCSQHHFLSTELPGLRNDRNFHGVLICMDTGHLYVEWNVNATNSTHSTLTNYYNIPHVVLDK